MRFIMEPPPFDLYSTCCSHDYIFADWLRCNHTGFSHRIECSFANDQVIENQNAESFSGRAYLQGQINVLLGRSTFATGVIVCQYDCRRVGSEGFVKNIGYADDGRVERPFVKVHSLDNLVLGVEAENDKVLSLGCLQVGDVLKGNRLNL